LSLLLDIVRKAQTADLPECRSVLRRLATSCAKTRRSDLIKLVPLRQRQRLQQALNRSRSLRTKASSELGHRRSGRTKTALG